MIDLDKQKLESEQAIGDMHQRAWDHSVKPFVDMKQAELYKVFVDHPSTDLEGLMLIKLQINSLTAMGDEFQSYINTGKLACQQLKENSDDD